VLDVTPTPLVALGRCLDVRGPSDRNGTPVQIWDCVRAPQQRWTLNARGQLVGLNGKCLQVVAQTSDDGQAVELWDSLDIPAQRWTLSTP
jgi:glucosylceramidase